VVESVKAASDLYLPMSGEIVEVNNSLVDTPEVMNSDPYGEVGCQVQAGMRQSLLRCSPRGL